MRRALILSTVLLLAACGGDDTKAEYLRDATAVCDRAVEETQALTFPTAPDQFAPYAESIVGIAEQAEEDLRALEPPEEDADELQRRVLDPFSDVVEEGRTFAENVREAGSDQAKLLPLLGQVPDAGEVDLEYLRSYGLDSCADAITRSQGQ